jgi:Metal binding domain of Ada
MRRIMALVALAISAWYLSSRQKRAWLQGRLQNMMPSLPGAGSRGAPATLDEIAVVARARAEDVRSRATTTANAVAGMARGASAIAVQKVEEVTSAAAQGASRAAANLQEAPSTVADQAEQAAKRATASAPKAAKRATGSAVEPAELAADVAPEPVEPTTGVAPEPAEPAAGAAAEPAAPAAPHSIHTAVDTPPPSGHETVQAGLADGDDKVRDFSAPTTPEPTEQQRVVRSKDATMGMEPPLVVDRRAEVAGHTSGQFVGNKSTRIYRPATSRNLPSERNRIYFDTEEEAGAAGFHPAGNRGQPGGGAKRPHR